MQIGKEITKFTQAGIKESIRTTNVLRNLNFNRKQFKTSHSGSGVNVSLLPTDTSEDFEHHFQVEQVIPPVADTTYNAFQVSVHAGFWCELAADGSTTTNMQTDAGNSYLYDDVKTLTLGDFGDFGVYFIKLQLAGTLDVVVDQVKNCETNERILARVNITGTSLADIAFDIEQQWTGGDIYSGDGGCCEEPTIIKTLGTDRTWASSSSSEDYTEDEQPYTDDWTCGETIGTGSSSSSEDVYEGVKVKLVTRVVYDPCGSNTIWQFIREFTYDSCGRLYDIGPEYRHVIDVPVAYTEL